MGERKGEIYGFLLLRFFCKIGYEEGYEKGFKRGWEKGYSRGFEDGLKVGLKDGMVKALLFYLKSKFRSADKIEKMVKKISESEVGKLNSNKVKNIKQKILSSNKLQEFFKAIEKEVRK